MFCYHGVVPSQLLYADAYNAPPQDAAHVHALRASQYPQSTRNWYVHCLLLGRNCSHLVFIDDLLDQM